MFKRAFYLFFCLLTLFTLEAKKHPELVGTDAQKNNIPPRYQWDGNQGYCGEVGLISAGLYYGQYASQYTVRSLASTLPQSNPKSQLLLGNNDQRAATSMHLKFSEWNTVSENNTDQFLAWVKQNVVKGYPVLIGIYTNEYLFYGNTDPNAGDSDYDHIVPVYGIASNHALNDPNYYGDDVLYFSDNGLWGSATNPPYDFSYSFDSFQASRKEANAKKGAIYSLADDGSNYGIVILGVNDLHGDTVPVRVSTNVNYEKPEIVDGSNNPPAPMPITLTITLSDLQPNVAYNLYKYNNFNSVPDSQFNANASKAYKKWKVQISSGNTYVFSEQIQSNEVAVYRAVKATAP